MSSIARAVEVVGRKLSGERGEYAVALDMGVHANRIGKRRQRIHRRASQIDAVGTGSSGKCTNWHQDFLRTDIMARKAVPSADARGADWERFCSSTVILYLLSLVLALVFVL